MSRISKGFAALVFALFVVLAFNAGREYQQASAVEMAFKPGKSAVTGLSLPRLEADGSLGRQPADGGRETVEEVWRTAKAHFVDSLDSRAAERKMAFGAARGMLAALGDPYTRFMEPDEYEEFQKETEGHFSGIGAVITMLRVPLAPEEAKRLAGTVCPICGSRFAPEAWRVGIQSPLSGSPAAKSGIRPGDFILAIDGVSTEGMDLETAVKSIRGTPGKAVVLKIGRHGQEGPIEKKIVRGEITVPNVEVKLPASKGGVGVITIRTFNDQAADAVDTGLGKMRSEKAAGVVIDVRNCAGGLLRSAIEISREFVPTGPVLQVQERGQRRRPEPANPRRPGPGFDLPVAVLVNGGTASAAEILAGAIQDAKKGLLVGERTFGKGLVQTVMPLRDGSAMAITTARYFTPSGRDINHTATHTGGIVPDQVVALPRNVILEQVRLTERDPQYAKALEVLRVRKAEGAAAH